jgi:uncharacterized BrkB/YihY/UPF0761 family membrane protein
MGASYLLFSTLMAVLTYVVPRLESKETRNAVGSAVIVAAVFTMYKIFDMYKFKTGHGMGNYLFDE